MDRAGRNASGGLRDALALLLRRPRSLALVVALAVVASAMEGFGLLLLVPLLEIVGIGRGAGPVDRIAVAVERGLALVGLEPSLHLVLLLYVLLVTLQAAVRREEQVRTIRMAVALQNDLRLRLFGAISRADWLFQLRGRRSDALQVLTDEVTRIGVALQEAVGLLATLVLAAVYLGVAAWISPWATAAALLVALLLLALLRPRAVRSREAGGRWSSASEAIYFSASEFLAGMKVAKSHGEEGRHRERFGEGVRRLSESWIDAVTSYADVRFLFVVGAVTFLSVLVWVAVALIELDAAALLLLLFIFVRLVPRFQGLQWSVQSVETASSAFRRVHGLLAEAEAAAEEAAGPPPATRDVRGGAGGAGSRPQPTLDEGILLQDVEFRYDGEGEGAGLAGVTVFIEAGATTAFVGPSGGGKTTLADLLVGLLRPWAGAILVDGVPLAELDQAAWKRGIGYVPQDTFLFDDTLRANLLRARPDAGEDDLRRALAAARLLEVVERLPAGLDTVVGDRGVRLSGGERQRVSLARALIREPRLLVLDEPTSALDYGNEELVRQALEELHGGTTVVVMTHRLPLVRGADAIHRIEEGRCVD